MHAFVRHLHLRLPELHLPTPTVHYPRHYVPQMSVLFWRMEGNDQDMTEVILHLRDSGGTDVPFALRLRAVLKRLLRSHQLRCVEITGVRHTDCGSGWAETTPDPTDPLMTYHRPASINSYRLDTYTDDFTSAPKGAPLQRDCRFGEGRAKR